MKKWIKFGIPIAAVVVLAAWYAFRPERLVINRRVDEANAERTRRFVAAASFFGPTFTALCTRRKVSPRSTGREVPLVFFA